MSSTRNRYTGSTKEISDQIWMVRVTGDPAPWTVYTRQSAPSTGWHNMQAYQAAIRATARTLWGSRPLLDGPVQLSFIFARKIPVTAGKRPRTRRNWVEKHVLIRPDLTNYIKAAEDGLTNIILKDDSQVIICNATKVYTEGEGYTCIIITALPKKLEEL